MPIGIKAWISKDGDNVENMSFFPTKKEANEFRKMTKDRDKVVECRIIIK